MLDAVTDQPHGEGSDGPAGRSAFRSPPGEGLEILDLVDCGRLPWHVVRYNLASGTLARAALHRLGVSTFLPLLRLAVPDRRVGRRIVTVPAFPGYLFAQWRPGFTWQRILAEPGVLSGPAGILRPMGDPYGHPQAVSPDFMDELMSRAKDGGVIEDASVPVPLPAIPTGAEVRVTKGPFAGLTGLCQLSSGERVAVLLQVLGGQRTVTAKRRDVERA